MTTTDNAILAPEPVLGWSADAPKGGKAVMNRAWRPTSKAFA